MSIALLPLPPYLPLRGRGPDDAVSSFTSLAWVSLCPPRGRGTAASASSVARTRRSPGEAGRRGPRGGDPLLETMRHDAHMRVVAPSSLLFLVRASVLCEGVRERANRCLCVSIQACSSCPDLSLYRFLCTLEASSIIALLIRLFLATPLLRSGSQTRTKAHILLP